MSVLNKKLLVALIAFIAIFHSNPGLQAQTLKVLSYNIYKGMSLDTSTDKASFVEWIDSLSPDIVALQEVNGFTQEKIEAMARKYGHPYALLLKEDGYPVALTSRYPIINARRVIDNMHHGFIQAQILDYNIIVLHLSPHKYWKRGEEIDLLLSTINSKPDGEKWMIMGDFNSQSPLDSMAYQDGNLKKRIRVREEKYEFHENLKNGEIDYSVIQKVLDNDFVDVLKAKNKNYISTVPTLRYAEQSPFGSTMRIDFMFVSENLKKDILKSTIIKDDFTNFNSDHYPVFMELKTTDDATLIANAQWETAAIEEGITHKRGLFKDLYGTAQYVNFIEVDMEKNYKTKVVVTQPLAITSETAKANKAIVAINGSYYSEATGEPVCYYRIDKNVIDTTHSVELFRVTGAMVIKKGKVSLIPWSKEIEKTYNDNKGVVLASGPLMIYKGNMCDVSKLPDRNFYATRHPRSAIGITGDGKMLLLTVDGRLPGYATGMSIDELAHLMQQLGCEYALNLDGGRSTTLWSSKETGNGVLNSPAANKKFDQWGERLNANTIIVTK